MLPGFEIAMPVLAREMVAMENAIEPGFNLKSAGWLKMRKERLTASFLHFQFVSAGGRP